MISYHPAFDPYHTAFRIVRLLNSRADGYQQDKARILDFHLIFPQAIEAISLPQHLVRWRKWSRDLKNPYWFHGDRWMVFSRMRPFFIAASQMLYGSQVLDRKSYDAGILRLDFDHDLTKQIIGAARQSITVDDSLVEFIVAGLGSIEFAGPDGLKRRTGLMEFRYDAI